MLAIRNMRAICKFVNINCQFNKYITMNKFSHYPAIRPARSLRETKYIEKDRIPNGFNIIYRAPMEHYLMASKNVTTITFCMLGTIISYKLLKGDDLLHLPQHEEFGGLVVGGSDLIYFGIGFLIITVIIRIIIEKYPLRIYRNRDSYIAIFQGQLPFKKQRLYFEKGDVSECSSIILNPWRESMYKVKNKSVLLLVDYFKTPSELNDMLTSKTNKN